MPKYQRRKFKQLIAVIYARFSCDKQRDESIEDQLRVCMEYAREHGITVIGQYCDYALSGRNDHRPQFLKMIADSQNGEFNTVLLWKMDRFARNRWDSAIYKKELFMNGVNVVSATEPIPEGGGGIIMESIYDGMAEMYSVQISQNVKRAARGNALKNKSNGGSLLFGYKVNPVTRQYELDEEAAPIVEEIFNRAAAGKPVRSIIEWLKSIGLPDDPEQIRKDPKLMHTFTRAKSRALIDFTKELQATVEKWHPPVFTSRNMYAPVILTPQAEEWMAQNFDDFLTTYDYTGVEAMPYMEGAADHADQWMQDLIDKVAQHPLGLRRTVFELQAKDWRPENLRPMPNEIMVKQMQQLLEHGAYNFGYYPDDPIIGHPDVRAIAPYFSARH